MQEEKNQLIRGFEQAEKEYEALPEWKKRLWGKSDFLKNQHDISRIQQVRYDNADWT